MEAVPLDRLRPAPWNPRSIKDERFQNLVRSIQTDAARVLRDWLATAGDEDFRLMLQALDATKDQKPALTAFGLPANSRVPLEQRFGKGPLLPHQDGLLAAISEGVDEFRERYGTPVY